MNSLNHSNLTRDAERQLASAKLALESIQQPVFGTDEISNKFGASLRIRRRQAVRSAQKHLDRVNDLVRNAENG